MNKWLNKLKVKAILPAAALIAAAAIGTTFAWKQWDLSVTNQLQAHTTQVSVQETFNRETKENVSFKNEGSSSVFLRVAYSEYWEKDGKILSNTVKDASGNIDSVAKKEWSDAWKNSTEWTHCSDGWSYYNTSLQPGRETATVLQKAELPATENLPEEYRGAEYHLYFKAEVVQCSDGSNTLNSDQVNVEAINSVFAKEIAKGNLTRDKNIYTVTWPNSVSWENFEGRRNAE